MSRKILAASRGEPGTLCGSGCELQTVNCELFFWLRADEKKSKDLHRRGPFGPAQGRLRGHRGRSKSPAIADRRFFNYPVTQLPNSPPTQPAPGRDSPNRECGSSGELPPCVWTHKENARLTSEMGRVRLTPFPDQKSGPPGRMFIAFRLGLRLHARNSR